MKKLPFVLFLLGAFFLSFGQNPLIKQWDKRYGGTNEDWLTTFQQTRDGGYILGGSSTSDSSADKTQHTRGSWDYWVVKIDSAGSKQWDKRFGASNYDQLTCLVQTKDGGYLLGGWSRSGSDGDKTQPGWGSDDYWIVKIDSLGNKEWDKTFGGTLNEHLNAVQEATDGGYILGGKSNSDITGDKTQVSQGDEDYWLVKTDSLGNKLWDKEYGGDGGDILFSMEKTKDGGYILGGYSWSFISGDKTQTSQGNSDYWLVKIDTWGNKEWDKTFGGNQVDWFASLHQTNDGGYVLGGISHSDSTGDKTQPLFDVIPHFLACDFWIVKTDSFGNKQWDKKFGGFDIEDYFGNVIQTRDGGYLMTGTSYSNISGDKSENNLGSEQSWAVKTDDNGNVQWDKTLHTMASEDKAGLGIQTKDGCYAFANYTYSVPGGDKTQGTQGGGDYWIIKFCDTTNYCQNVSATIVSNNNIICINDSAHICAPVGFVNYQWNNSANTNCIATGLAGNYYVTVTDANGCSAESNHLSISTYPSSQVSFSVNGDTLSVYNSVAQEWYLNGSIISGATDSIYIASQSGIYTVVVTDVNGCNATSNSIVLSDVFVGPNSNSGFRILPNPASQSVIISVDGNTIGSNLILSDITGRKIKEENIKDQNTQFEIKNLVNGIYFFTLSNGRQTIAQKLVVSK